MKEPQTKYSIYEHKNYEIKVVEILIITHQQHP